MKKNLLFLGMAVAALASCTNDEVFDINKSNKIQFDGFVNKDTRAVTNTDGDITKFHVFGYYGTTNVFNNVAVSKDGATWSYTNPVAWTANQYQFGAYATKNESDQLAAVAFADGKLTFTNYTAADANDLVAAVAAVDNTGLTNATVGFTFKHLLSKVKFALTNGTDKGYTMKVSNITFNVLPAGTCVYDGAATWTPSGSASSLSFAGTTANIAAAATFTSEDHIVIPSQGLAEMKANFKVEFYDASSNKVDEKEYTNVALKLNDAGTETWKPGYSYTYTANITSTTNYIQFDVTSVDVWTEQNAGAKLN